MNIPKVAVLTLAAIAAGSSNAQFASQEHLEREMEQKGYPPGKTLWTNKPMKDVDFKRVPGFSKFVVNKWVLELDQNESARLEFRNRLRGGISSALLSLEEPNVFQMRVRALVTDESGKDIKLVIGNTSSTFIKDGDEVVAYGFMSDDPKIKYKKWGGRVFKAITNFEVFIGMTSEQVVVSWGLPKTINTTTGKWGSQQQWIYGDSPGETTYLYMNNGKLTAFQN